MAAVAEAALRTRGKLLADRTPGRDEGAAAAASHPRAELGFERAALCSPADGPAGAGAGRKPGSGPAGLRAAAAAEQQASARRGGLEAAAMH